MEFQSAVLGFEPTVVALRDVHQSAADSYDTIDSVQRVTVVNELADSIGHLTKSCQQSGLAEQVSDALPSACVESLSAGDIQLNFKPVQNSDQASFMRGA